MWSSKRFLERCERLKSLGHATELEPGERVGRKFADLGVEEFLLLPGRKILSLFTGQVSELVEAHTAHLFSVPSPDELVSLIRGSRFDLEAVRFPDQRDWEIVLKDGESGDLHTVTGGRLDEALAEAYCFILESGC